MFSRIEIQHSSSHSIVTNLMALIHDGRRASALASRESHVWESRAALLNSAPGTALRLGEGAGASTTQAQIQHSER